MLLFYITHPDKEAAVALCDTLLRERLIACYNLLPMESAYWWQGDIAREKEVATLLKTRAELAEQVEERVKGLHSYAVPCIMRWEVEANEAYEQWIYEETSSS